LVGGAQPAAATFTDDRQQFVVNTSLSNTTEDLSGNSDTLLITGSGSIKNDCRQ
jgi:hypothetical protein